MKTFGQRIAFLRTKERLTQVELAVALDISRGHLATIERDGAKPSFELLSSLAEFFKVSLDYLIYGDEAQENKSLKNSISTDKKEKMPHIETTKLSGTQTTEQAIIAIPEYNIKAAAGDELAVSEIQNPVNYWKLPLTALAGIRATSLNNLAIITVSGDSMEPDYSPGEKILVDQGDNQIHHDGVYVLWNGFGLVVKMIQILPANPPKLRIISKNKDYPPYEVYLQDVQINGRVVGKWVWK